jgi:hypothetical protein
LSKNGGLKIEFVMKGYELTEENLYDAQAWSEVNNSHMEGKK